LHWKFFPSTAKDQKLFEELKGTKTSLALFNFRHPMGSHLGRLRRSLKTYSQDSRLFNYTGDFHRLPIRKMPQMDVLTDIVGIGTYSRDFGQYLQQVHQLLKDDGVLYCGIGYDTKFFIEDVDGRREVSIPEFFAQIPGFSFRGDIPTFALNKTDEPFIPPRISTEAVVAKDLAYHPVPDREITIHLC